MKKVKPVPDGFCTVTPYLTVSDARKQIEFLKRAFRAKQIMFHDMGGGHVHAEVKIGDSIVMIGETATPMPSMIYLYVKDADADYKRAMAAGAESIDPISDRFYGDRSGGVKDRFGNIWYISTHTEEVPPKEMRKRAAAAHQ